MPHVTKHFRLGGRRVGEVDSRYLNDVMVIDRQAGERGVAHMGAGPSHMMVRGVAHMGGAFPYDAEGCGSHANLTCAWEGAWLMCNIPTNIQTLSQTNIHKRSPPPLSLSAHLIISL